MNRCPGTKRDGSRCTVTVDPPQTYCWWHDPANAEARKRAAARGGKRAGRGRPQTELADLKAEVRDVIEAVRSGELDKGVGAVLGQLYNVLLKAVSVGLDVEERQELVARLEALEQTLEANRRSGSYGA